MAEASLIPPAVVDKANKEDRAAIMLPAEDKAEITLRAVMARKMIRSRKANNLL